MPNLPACCDKSRAAPLSRLQPRPALIKTPAPGGSQTNEADPAQGLPAAPALAVRARHQPVSLVVLDQGGFLVALAQQQAVVKAARASRASSPRT